MVLEPKHRNLGANFYKKLIDVCKDVSMKPEDLLNVMAFESGIDPSKPNMAGGSASGLLQFIPSTLKGLGYKGSMEEFRAQSGEEQLQYVKKLIQENMRINGGQPFKSAAHYYVANLVPAALKIPGVREQNLNTIILSKDGGHLPGVRKARERKYYEKNKGLDVGNKGYITFGDLQARLNQAKKNPEYIQAINNLRSYTSSESESVPQHIVPKLEENNMELQLNRLLDETKKSVASLNKKYLPKQNICIQVNGKNQVDCIEFASILGSVLDEELFTNSSIYINNDNLELSCDVNCKNINDYLNIINKLAKITLEEFKTATIKLKDLDININSAINKKACGKELNLNEYELNHRKFLLKFA
jgi:hypothetical protein